jgi:Zn-dependent protease with chaperone function
MSRSGRSLFGNRSTAQDSSLDRAYLALGERLGESLEREMIAADALAPRLSASLALAIGIAALTYAAAIAVAAGGAALIAFGAPNGFMIVLGALLLAAAAVTCPRPVRRRRVRDGVSIEDTPLLHDVITRVARALEVPSTDVMLFNTRFNASWGHDGLRRRRVLRLGVPLVAYLDSQQLVALLAHELAHERNGDVRRGRLVGSSLESIASVLDTLRPQRNAGFRGLAALMVPFTNLLLWLCRQPVRGLLVLQTHLLFRDSQRAEFLADDLSARVAGTAAAVGVLDALLSQGSVEVAIRRVTLSRDRQALDVLDEIGDAAARVDPDARAKQRTTARTECRRLASTHPTTAGRIAVLERRPHRTGSVELTDAEQTALAAELRNSLSAYVPALLERDRERLYFG